MERIGPYEIVGEVGRGGMGVVYRAMDRHIGREVAVKIIRFADMIDPDEQEQLRGRLFREARAAGILKHPGIVTIYYVGEEQGVAFIAMEFVNGPTLEKLLLADTPVDKERIRQILRETAAALNYAHKKGVIHRDVKPANIMLEDNEIVKICDFGIAKGFSGLASMTQTGMVIGTPHYMPPEQIQGKGVDARADQYALAVIAFQMLTGRRPFLADSIQTLFYRIMVDPPENAHAVNPTLPAAVSEVFGRALAKEAGNRYATCGEFVAELLAACDTRPDWSPLSRKGLTSSGSTPARSARPAPPAVAPEPPPPSPPVSLPPKSAEATPEPPVWGFKAPESQREPVPPPQPGGGRCQQCGGVAQPGLDLCAFCAFGANFGLAPPPQPTPGEGSAVPVPSVEEQAREAREPVARTALGAEPGVAAAQEKAWEPVARTALAAEPGVAAPEEEAWEPVARTALGAEPGVAAPEEEAWEPVARTALAAEPGVAAAEEEAWEPVGRTALAAEPGVAAPEEEAGEPVARAALAAEPGVAAEEEEAREPVARTALAAEPGGGAPEEEAWEPVARTALAAEPGGGAAEEKAWEPVARAALGAEPGVAAEEEEAREPVARAALAAEPGVAAEEEEAREPVARAALGAEPGVAEEEEEAREPVARTALAAEPGVAAPEEEAREPVARTALGAEPGVAAAEESGDAQPEFATEVGFTNAFTDIVPAPAPPPVSVPPEQEKPSEESGEPLQALTEPSATPTPVREEETADRSDTNLELPSLGLSTEPERADRRRMLVALLVAAAGLAVIVGGFWLTQGRTERLRIVEFTSDREAAEPLQPVVLRWKVTGADSSRIAPGVGSVPPAGEITVHPKVSTTYTLEAVRNGETLGARVAVSVAKPTGPSGPSQELQARLAKARVLINQGLYDNAIAAYQAILAADSGNRQAQAGIAEARAAKEAELRLTGDGGARPQDALRTAQRLYKNGEYEAAITAFEQVLAAEPGNARAKKGIAAARAADEAEKRLR